MIMRKCLALFASMLLFASCDHKISVVGQYDCQPDIFPHYKDVTIPCNIAPMNFEFMGNGPSRLLLLAGDDTLTIKPQRGVYSFGERFCKKEKIHHENHFLNRFFHSSGAKTSANFRNTLPQLCPHHL